VTRTGPHSAFDAGLSLSLARADLPFRLSLLRHGPIFSTRHAFRALGRAVGRLPDRRGSIASMELGQKLDVRTRTAWRTWLRQNHARKKEIWLVLHAKASGKTSISYNDAVDEALCFGWIDSIVKTVGTHARAQRFTPRRAGSPVSEMNKARARRLVREGRMTATGRAALGTGLRRERLVVAPDVRRALRATPRAWGRFERLPAAYKRIRLGFIEGARGRPEVFATRLRYFVRMTAQGKRYGMVRS
jgi:uncharacterized protein YdeI (YjbR/CyaY-like superfamily)